MRRVPPTADDIPSSVAKSHLHYGLLLHLRLLISSFQTH